MNGLFVQILATAIVSMLHFFLGVCVTWSSYATITLSANDTGTAILGRPLTTYESGLVGSLGMLGCLPSSILAGYLAGAIGRRNTEVFCALAGVVSTTLIATARSVPQLLIGRFISGFSGGSHLAVSFVFISEICQPSIRGSMASLLIFAYCFGMLTSYVCGWMFTLQVVNNMFLAFMVLATVLICLLKESPVYLVSVNRYKDALSSLKFYRRTSLGSLTQELSDLKKQRLPNDNDAKDSLLLDKRTAKQSSTIQILRNSKSAQRALVTVLGFVILSIFMGGIAVHAYAGSFFLKVAPNISRHLCSVILAVVVTIGSAVGTVVTDLLGRRVLMISSCLTCTACLALLASQLHWSWSPDWVPAAVCLVFACVYQIGANNIPMVQLAESFEAEIKAFASAITMSCLSIGNFLLLFFYQIVAETFGMDGTFLLFTIISGLTTVLAYLIMKETKGISFKEISAMYEQGYLYKRNCRNKC